MMLGVGVSGMNWYLIGGFGYLAFVVIGGMFVLRRRMDGIQNEQRAAQHHRERLDRVVHDEVIPAVRQMAETLEQVDKALHAQMSRARLAAQKSASAPMPEAPAVPPGEFKRMRDDLIELAQELQRSSSPPDGVKEAARTGGRRLSRAVSRHIPAHARRRPPPV